MLVDRRLVIVETLFNQKKIFDYHFTLSPHVRLGRRQIVWWGLIVACGGGEVGLGGVRGGGWPFFYREFKLVLYMVPKVKN